MMISGMMYELKYSPEIRKDLKKISPPDRESIKFVIETKLCVNPIEYGKPLRYSLRGMRRLRVGNYRIVFRILHKTLYIEAIAHRKDIYKSIGK